MDLSLLLFAPGLIAVLAWFYPALRARRRAARSAAALRAVAADRKGAVRALDDPRHDQGFLPTLQSVFGPHTEVPQVVAVEREGEDVLVCEVRFGRRGSWWAYRRSVPVVVVRLRRPLPTFTLCRPRKPAESRTTAFEVRGQRLVVTALGPLELWAREREVERALALIPPALEDALASEPGWELRGADRWLVLFNERLPSAEPAHLAAYLDRACALRALLAGRAAPRAPV